jgi:hypothetical protein
MDLLRSPFPSIIQLQSQLSLQEQGVESDIAAFLRAGSAEETQLPGAHTRLEELRFARNMLRYRLMDVEAAIKARKQSHFESKVLEAFALLYPEMNLEFKHELSLQPFSVTGYDCPEMILQSIQSCYRKIETSFNDQSSMLIQMGQNESKAVEMKDWFERVNHAFMKSQTFFSRQCAKARSLRTQFSEAFCNNEKHYQFNILRARYGAGMIDQLAAAIDDRRKKAA